MKTEKNNLRAAIRRRLYLLTEQEKERQSADIWQQMEALPAFQSAGVVLLYWSLPGEVDTHGFIEKWRRSKTILLPVVAGDELLLREYAGLSRLRAGAFGICAPAGGKAFAHLQAIDLCIVPAVAFDGEGNRLGRGKGFYDRLLARVPAPKAGVCFDVQLVEHVPHEKWDVRMNIVLSFQK